MRRDSLVDVFADLASAHGTFLVYDDGFRTHEYTYRDVARAARGFAARLREASLKRGDKVVFYSENRPEWIVAFWACILEGIIVVPIDYRSPSEFLARVAGIVAATLVLTGDEVPALSLPTHIRVWPLHRIDWDSGIDPQPAASVASGFPVRRSAEREGGSQTNAAKDDIAEIIFTSGATAEPKGVVITHRNILANIVPVEGEVMKYRKWGTPFFPIRFLNLLPLSHMFGQAMATFIPPMLPGVVCFMRGYNPDAIATLIKSRRISVLVCVPKILDVLREHVLRLVPPEQRSRDETFTPTGGAASRILKRWWRYRVFHRVFGWKFWAFVVGAAPLEPELEGFWGERGFAVIQGYGLTETAPIVSLNHPFGTKRGSVGKAMGGVEIRIAEDGEILVRGENVARGYFAGASETALAGGDGWFHTGDIGELSPGGELFIRGRKKEMIVTAEGLNVFPEDVERVLNHLPGVRDSAVVGVPVGGEAAERVHAVLVLDPGTSADEIVRAANAQLSDPQRIRRALVWPEAELPRTEGTRKLKRAAIREWLKSGTTPAESRTGGDPLLELIAKHAGKSDIGSDASLEELGLSSLERVELMVALEDTFHTRIDEGQFAEARDLSALRALVEQGSKGAAAGAPAVEPVEFPRWNRSRLGHAIRRISLPTWILPLARPFVRLRVEGAANLAAIDAPVIFAANHQSHMDTPVVMLALPPRLRYRLAPAMAKEFFKAHFFPEQFSRREWFTNSLNYYLAAEFFNAFPLPQREAGARQTLRYIGEVLNSGYSVLIFPEGRRDRSGTGIEQFRPGIGMIASRLDVPVVPVRLEGLETLLPPGAKWPTKSDVRVAFGPPLRLEGSDYSALAKQVEDAVRRL